MVATWVVDMVRNNIKYLMYLDGDGSMGTPVSGILTPMVAIGINKHQVFFL